MCLQNYIYVIQKQQPTPGFLEKYVTFVSSFHFVLKEEDLGGDIFPEKRK